MNKKIWFISDLMLDQRPPTELFNEWSKVVGKDDGVAILGNVAVDNKAFWFEQIGKLPGEKVLFCGNLETNRIKWYHKFGFSGVVPFDETKLLKCKYGNVLISHLPAFETVVANTDTKYRGLIRKFEKMMDVNSCVLNIHGHVQNKGNEKHNTWDVSYSPSLEGFPLLLNMDQIVEYKFKR